MTPRRGYPMVIWDPQSGSVSENSGSGVRLRLADRRGFNFVRLLGDCQGMLLLDPNAPRARSGVLVSAGEGESEYLKRVRITDVVTEGGFFRKLLAGAAVTPAVRFYGGEGGTLADIGFYRVGAPDKPYRA